MIATESNLADKCHTLIEYVGDFDSQSVSKAWRAEVDLLVAEIAKQRLDSHRDRSYSHGLGDLPVLSRAEEERLFRAMNLLKYQIRQLQIRSVSRRSSFKTCSVGQLSQQTKIIRDFLIFSNLRLVISLVKKFVTPYFSFDELYSEGIVTLMQAVEKFNYQKGFRFSTYAYRSISRALYNLQLNVQQEQAVVVPNYDGRIESSAQPDRSPSLSETWWTSKRECLSKLVKQLDRREQLIVRARYALTPRGTIKTFQTIADKLGISKERVRQLEQRALQKLQSMASEVEIV